MSQFDKMLSQYLPFSKAKALNQEIKPHRSLISTRIRITRAVICPGDRAKSSVACHCFQVGCVFYF